MRVLVQVCCADCLVRFFDGKTEIEGYFYNPNIQPRAEYLCRLAAAQKIAGEKKLKLIVADWSPKEYFGAVKNDKKRCENCWKLRIEKTAEYAKASGFEYFSTTLLSSQYQNREMIKKIGEAAGKKYGVKFWEPEKIERELKTKGFYKQFFCGCGYSMVERMEEKYKERE